MNESNNPVIEEMYNQCKEDFFNYIYKNNKDLKNKSKTTLESLSSIYELINQSIQDKSIVNLLYSKMHIMIQNYTNEFDLVSELYYKHGVINGIENYNKIKKAI